MRGATGRAPPTGGRCSRRSSAKITLDCLHHLTAEDIDDLVPLSCRAAYDAAYHNWLGSTPTDGIRRSRPLGRSGPVVPLRRRGGAGAATSPGAQTGARAVVRA